MPRPRRQEFVAREFAARLQTAMENNPNVPPKYHGERTWLAERLLTKGVTVGKETIRKWLEGESLPTSDKIPVIAEVLSIDAQWLMFGNTVPQSDKLERHYQASALAHVVAGLIELDGGTVAFPLNDTRVKSPDIHLHAVLRAANYPLHIAGGQRDGDTLIFKVPPTRTNFIVLGVVRREGFAFDVYELTDEVVADHGVYERGSVRITAPVAALRKIESFSERL